MKNKFIPISAVFAICFSLTGCNQSNDKDNNNNSSTTVLNVYNCADYINEDVLTEFEEYCLNTLNKKVEIKYSTYETNEDLYNQLKAGGVQYDLVCPSEYMIEKMLINDMLEPLDKPIVNYQTYGSKYVSNIFSNLKTTIKKENKEVSFGEYAVPYMWGTMGFMYDPEHISLEEVSSWDIIWDTNHKNQTSLKNSIRDTYITSTLHIYKEELELAKKTLTGDEYNKRVTEIMNRCDDKTINLVEADLKKAKENIYEFEVDTGKENIIKGKYYVNLCWSGDAVYSLDTAEESDFYLNYKVPEEGSNIWFDGWVMPKGANKGLAQELMNFLCDPKIASKNMDEVGYTSAIAGQDMWALVNEWYNSDEGETTEYDLTYFFKDTNIVDEDGNLVERFIIHTSEENRQLYAQYPDLETINRCGVMQDFGEQNDKVSEMWIRVQGNSTSWVVIVFLIVVVGLVVFFEIKSSISKRARKRRNIK